MKTLINVEKKKKYYCFKKNQKKKRKKKEKKKKPKKKKERRKNGSICKIIFREERNENLDGGIGCSWKNNHPLQIETWGSGDNHPNHWFQC